MNQITWNVCWTLLLVIKSSSDQHWERLPSQASWNLNTAQKSGGDPGPKALRQWLVPSLAGDCLLLAWRWHSSPLPVSHTYPTSHFLSLPFAYQEFWASMASTVSCLRSRHFYSRAPLRLLAHHSLADLALVSHPCSTHWGHGRHI